MHRFGMRPRNGITTLTKISHQFLSEIQFIFLNEKFEFAVGMAQTVAPHKLKAVQRQLAVHLQASDHWKEAEEAFVKV
jgi:hypothetical protein